MKKSTVFGIMMLLAILLISGCTPALNSAIEDGDAEKVRTLIKAGANVNARGFFSQDTLFNAIDKRRVDIVSILLDAGADVNIRSFGRTPLHEAALVGPLQSVKLLVDKGADVNAVDDMGGMTPLMMAALRMHTDIIEFLITKGADIDSAIAISEAKAAQYPQDSDWVAAAKLLAKYALQKVGQTITTVSISNNETQPSTLIKSDIDDLPSIKAKSNKNSFAIVIGIENYRQKLPKADFAANDAKLITEYLTKVMGYPEENVIVLLNEQAAKSDFEKYIEEWLPKNFEKDGGLFVYYSGHGAPNPKTGDAFLVPYDGDPNFIEKTGYSLKKLYENLSKLPAKKVVVVLDSCFSGAGGRSVLAQGSRPLVMNLQKTMPAGKNMIVMAASSGTEISSTYQDKGHGLFTYYLLKGIKGEADTNEDGKIELDELYQYLKPNVQKTARRLYNNEQTPQLIAPEALFKNVLLQK